MTTITFFNQLTAMPKRLAMLLTVLFTLGVGSMWGAEVAFDATKDKGSSSTGKVSYEKDGITLSVENGALGNGTDYRVYKNTTLTISSTVGNITNINLTYTSSSYDGGDWATDYQPNADSWTSPTASGEQARIKTIVVTYTSSGGGNTGGDSGDDSGDAGDDSDGECTWQLVTDASTLKVGDKIVIAASTQNYALSTTQNSNNRSATAITKSNNTITFNEAVQIITLAQGSTTGTLSFFVGSGYLYAASSSKNYMRTQTTPGTNGDWIIGINNGVATIQAQGDNTNNVIRYNPNSGSPIFACYASSSTTGSLPSIYKKVCTTETTVCVIPKCGGDGGGTWLVVIEWFATF